MPFVKREKIIEPEAIQKPPRFLTYEELVNDDFWKEYLKDAPGQLKLTKDNASSSQISIETVQGNDLEAYQRFVESELLFLPSAGNISMPDGAIFLGIYDEEYHVQTKSFIQLGRLVSFCGKSEEKILAFVNKISHIDIGDPYFNTNVFGRDGIFQHFADFSNKKVHAKPQFNGLKVEYWPRLDSFYNS